MCTKRVFGRAMFDIRYKLDHYDFGYYVISSNDKSLLLEILLNIQNNRLRILHMKSQAARFGRLLQGR